MTIRELLGLQTDREWRLFMKKLSAFVLQYLPLMSDILLLSINLMRSFGYKGGLLVSTEGSLRGYHSAAFVIMLLWWGYLMSSSKFLGFCKLHRVQITYFVFSFICICIQRWNRFDNLIEWLAYLCSAIGVAIIAYTFVVMIKHKGVVCEPRPPHDI